MAEENLPFVYSVVSAFVAGVPAAARFRRELESAGAMALLRACIRFDYRGALTTYAERFVYGAVRKEWRELTENIRRPRLGDGGCAGLAPPLVRDPDMSAVYGMPSTMDVEAELDAARLQARVIPELVRRMDPTGECERNARIFLDGLLDDDLGNRDLAELHGVSRERVRQLRARVGEVFQSWAAEIRAEA